MICPVCRNQVVAIYMRALEPGTARLVTLHPPRCEQCKRNHGTAPLAKKAAAGGQR